MSKGGARAVMEEEQGERLVDMVESWEELDLPTVVENLKGVDDFPAVDVDCSVAHSDGEDKNRLAWFLTTTPSGDAALFD
eukprot:10301063-Karenia_brevis.AAC.1